MFTEKTRGIGISSCKVPQFSIFKQVCFVIGHHEYKHSILFIFSFTNDLLKRPLESRKHGIFCESNLAPEEKYLEIQNCVSCAPN